MSWEIGSSSAYGVEWFKKNISFLAEYGFSNMYNSTLLLNYLKTFLNYLPYNQIPKKFQTDHKWNFPIILHKNRKLRHTILLLGNEIYLWLVILS